MVQLGQPIRLLWGEHHGKKAWINDNKTPTKLKYHIVVLEEDQNLSLTETTAYKYMVVKGHYGKPKPKHEAVFEKFPELEQELNAVFSTLAKCDIEPSKELSDFLYGRFILALKHQRSKGYKAERLHIDYKSVKSKKAEKSVPTKRWM